VEPAAATSAFTRWQWVVLLLATAVAAWLRLHDLGTWSMWIDEAHTWRDATMPLGGDNGFLRSERALYPLTSLALRALLAKGWIGGDEYSLRLPFALVGILTVPLLAFCGRRLVGVWPALLAAWFLALNPWHVFWSQNARGYVVTCCLAAVACNRAHAYATTLRTRDMVATMVAIAIAALAHPSGGMLAAGLGTFLVLQRTDRLYRRFVLWAVVITAVIAVVLPWAVAKWLPFQGFLRSKDDPSLLHLLQTTAFYFRPLVLLAAGGCLVFAWRWLGREKALLLGCLVAVPFFVLLVIGGQIAKVTARYAICTLPALTWLAALACVRIGELAAGPPQRRRRRLFAAGLALPLLLVADQVPGLVDYYTSQYGQRSRWREACEFVRARAKDGPLRVLTVNEPTIVYYLRPQHWATAGVDPNPMVEVLALVDWKLDGIWRLGGSDEKEVTMHPPGGMQHLAWHLAEAKKRRAQFVVMVTAPELAEVDQHDGSLRRGLLQDYELVLHLPCWVGPKDEGVYVYVPKGD